MVCVKIKRQSNRSVNSPEKIRTRQVYQTMMQSVLASCRPSFRRMTTAHRQRRYRSVHANHFKNTPLQYDHVPLTQAPQTFTVTSRKVAGMEVVAGSPLWF